MDFKKNYLLGFFIIIIIHFPLLILGEDAYIHISDNLFSDHLYLHLLKLGGHLFCINPTHIIDYMLDGIPTSTIYSNFNLINIFYYILPSFWAYTVNSIVVKTVGFCGAYWLVKEYSKINKPIIILLIALFYSTVPIFVVYGISISGLPILFMAFWSLAKGIRIGSSFSIIIMYTFYSHFFLVGPFVISTIFILGFFYIKKTDMWYWKGFIALIFLSLIINYNFLHNYFLGEVSHRQEYGVFKNFSFFESSLKTVFLFLRGQYNFSQIFIFPILILVMLNKKIKETYPLITIIFMLCVFVGFYETLISFLVDDFNPPFDFSRFSILIPLLILFLIIKSSEGRIYYLPTIILLSLQIIINIYIDEDLGKNIMGVKKTNYVNNLLNTKVISPLNSNIKNSPLKQISNMGFFGSDGEISLLDSDINISSYKSFYCESLFDEIAIFMDADKKSFRTINVGFPPAINQYNGFYTLDGYHNYYPLTYKKKFLKIIRKEIIKDSELLNYFENRANACFLFSSELVKSCGYNCNKFNSSEIKINDLEIDTSAFKQMKGKYLMSSVEIINFEKMGFNFLRSFKSQDCDYIIYLYSVKLI